MIVLTPREIFERLGGAGESPRRLGAHRGPLLILGGGRCVWEDLARVRPWGGEIMAVNDIGSHYPGRIKHWCSLHPQYFEGWLKYRLGHCYGESQPVHTHAIKASPAVETVWPRAAGGGTSGGFAPLVGLMLGYDPIVLAGIPLDSSGHYFDPPWAVCNLGDRHLQIEWRQLAERYFKGRVTSLSGRTRAWLGAPAWLPEVA